MNLFKISIISSLFLHFVVFFLLKNLEISVEENENLDLQIVSQIITKNDQEPEAPVPPPEPIAPTPPPEPVAPVPPPEPIAPTELNEFEPIPKDESNNELSPKDITKNSVNTEKTINNEIDKIKNYKNSIYKILEKRKKYPKIALRKKWEGEVVIAIHYDVYGLISKINIHKSSGKSVLDRAALDIVNDSLMEDLPTTPNTLNGKILLFTIDFLLNT